MLKDFLDEKGVEYVTIQHSPAFTAQGIAHSAHVPGKEMAKTTILRRDDELVMAVMPANQKVDVTAFAEAVDATHVELAREPDFAQTFSGCELGAMPPFGNLWGVPVYVSEELGENENITFNAGSHVELVRMRYTDFERLVHPVVMQRTHAVL
jgi:Ala-tRNA(Pro) deacylase